PPAAPGNLLNLERLLAFFSSFGAVACRFSALSLARRLEPGRDRLRLGAPATRTASTTTVTLLGRLAPAIRAVGRLPLSFLDLFPHRRRLTRLDDRVGERLGDQLHRPDRVVVARDRDRDEVRVGVGIGNGDDRDAELVGLVDGDALLL